MFIDLLRCIHPIHAYSCVLAHEMYLARAFSSISCTINIGKKSHTRRNASLTVKSLRARIRESWRIVSTLGVWVNIVAASLPVAISVVLAKI